MIEARIFEKSQGFMAFERKLTAFKDGWFLRLCCFRVPVPVLFKFQGLCAFAVLRFWVSGSRCRCFLRFQGSSAFALFGLGNVFKHVPWLVPLF